MYPIDGTESVISSMAPGISWPKKHDVLGVQVSATTYAEIIELLIEAATNRARAIVDFSPVDIIVQAARNPVFLSKINSFNIVCPDGQPVRWWLNHFHAAGLRERVCGTTTMLQLCDAAARSQVPIYLYGSTLQTLAKLRVRLLGLYPNLLIAGIDSPPFRPLTPEEDLAVVERISASGAGIVFVGIGAPKQENFAWDHREKIQAVQLCVGAAFDFIAGTKKRAPEWMQRVGLEWLHRLGSEPRRLGERYCKSNVQFLIAVITAVVRLRIDGKLR